MPRSIRNPRSTLSTVLGLALLLLGAAALAQGCASDDELAAALRLRATELARAVVQRDAPALEGFFSRDATTPGLPWLARGPLIFRRLEIVAVAPAGRGHHRVWNVDYEAEISSYPSALINFFVRPEVLESGHQLKPYEELVQLSGRLVWKRRGGEWKVVETPPEHQPVGRACALGRALENWRGETVAGSKGTAAFAAVLPLLDTTYEANHAGPATRAETLLGLADKLHRVATTAGTTVLHESFMPTETASVDGPLKALASLDRLLAAWWHGEIEDAADLLSSPRGRRLPAAELAASPVTLHSYAVSALDADGADRFVVSTRLELSDPAWVLALLPARAKIPDPASFLRQRDRGLEVEEVFFVSLQDGHWLVECDPDRGAIGYLVRTGRLLDRRLAPPPLPANREALNTTLALETAVAFVLFDDLEFPPLQQRLSGERKEEFMAQVAANVMSVVAAPAGGIDERCFRAGKMVADYTVGISLKLAVEQAGVDLDVGDRLARSRHDVLRVLDSLLPRVDTSPYRRDLVMADVSGNVVGLAELAIDVARDIERNHGERARHVFLLGHQTVFLHGMTAIGEEFEMRARLTREQETVADRIENLVGDLSRIRPIARATVRDLARRARRSELLTSAEVESLTDYDWFFPPPDPEG